MPTFLEIPLAAGAHQTEKQFLPEEQILNVENCSI
jgi:hypothetical protein